MAHEEIDDIGRDIEQARKSLQASLDRLRGTGQLRKKTRVALVESLEECIDRLDDALRRLGGGSDHVEERESASDAEESSDSTPPSGRRSRPETSAPMAMPGGKEGEWGKKDESTGE